MSYTDDFALAADFSFQSRIMAAATEQAVIFVNDARPEFVAPSRLVIRSNGNATPFFALVAGQPDMTAESDDASILAALQYVWPIYGSALLAEDVEPA